MTDPMGRHWRQPPRERILIDDTHALMDLATFEQLSEYSCTIPTGVYPGKMWAGAMMAHSITRARDHPSGCCAGMAKFAKVNAKSRFAKCC